MNKLAHVIHDVMTGAAELDTVVVSTLSPEERAALHDLQDLLHKSPSELAALIAQEGSTTVWYGPTQKAKRPAGS